MENYAGEKFLDKLYNNLYMSNEVQHTKENTDKRYEAIRRYLERLHRVHQNADTKTKKELLKRLYYDKYVISSDILLNKIKSEHNYITEEALKEKVNKIINAQKQSLDKWLDYLTDEHTNYPMWAKYWAFQGMLKIGAYDEGIEGYLKRSKDTESPFVDANPEIIAKAISTIEKSIIKEDINDEELEKLIQSGNFSKIYTILEKRYKDNVIEYSGIEGKWIKYNQGSKEDAIKLSESLQGKNTHWCTADRQTAIMQVCGPYNTENGGDFYVYYTRDKEENYTLPRIAMRMNGHNEIGEIRGIEDGQNLEEELVPVFEEKLKEMNNITKNSKKYAFEIIDGLKELTEIYKKTIQKQELTEQEIEDLYSKKFGFGFSTDPREIRTIKKRNVAADFNNLKDNKIKVKIYEEILQIRDDIDIRNSLILDESFVKEYIRSENNYTLITTVLEKINPETITDYEGIAHLAIRKYGILIRYINPKYIVDYDRLCKLAVYNYEDALMYINPNDITIYEELALIVAKQGKIKAVNHPEAVSNYEELARISVTAVPESISGVKPQYVTNYDELCKIAVSIQPHALSFIEKEYTTIYDELAAIYATQGTIQIRFINPKDIKDYDTLAKIAVKKHPSAIQYIIPENVTNYDELCKLAVSEDPNVIECIRIEYTTIYDELAMIAIMKMPSIYYKIYQSKLKNPMKFKDYYYNSCKNNGMFVLRKKN